MPQQNARPTQEFVEMRSIDNGVITLKNGALRQILIVSGLNFDLKSEEEQKIILDAYQNFLNGLKFSIQFFIHSRKLNIGKYLALLEGRATDEKNELLRNQVNEYIQFIRSFVEKNPIMTKTFFVVVPFDPIVLPETIASPGKAILEFFGKSVASSAPKDADHGTESHRDQLAQRVSQVTSALSQIGLRAVPLEDEEIVDLFYNLYNPEAKERKAQVPQEGIANSH